MVDGAAPPNSELGGFVVVLFDVFDVPPPPNSPPGAPPNALPPGVAPAVAGVVLVPPNKLLPAGFGAPKRPPEGAVFAIEFDLGRAPLNRVSPTLTRRWLSKDPSCSTTRRVPKDVTCSWCRTARVVGWRLVEKAHDVVYRK